MKDENYIENLIGRYLNGNCAQEDHQELKKWIDESDNNKTEFLRLKDIWDSTAGPKDKTEEKLIAFYKNQLEKSNKSRLLWVRYSSIAAAVLLIGFILSVLLPQIVVRPQGNMQVFSVPMGSKSKVFLADGTEVNLNSGSELKFPENYSASSRVVCLTGEAFFKVKSDPSHPFLVKTTDFDVKVTGTQFNVCTYDDNTNSSATLAEGKIHLKMNGSSQAFEIRPGEKFDLNRETHKYDLDKADVESEIAWKDNELIFSKIRFPELAKRLERWYDVKLNYSDSKLINYTFTGKFKNQESIWQVLDALKLTAPIDYRKNSFREFTISYKPLKLK
jgi:ferric-dicitrate binding protein FerR (iron transport regulator)